MQTKTNPVIDNIAKLASFAKSNDSFSKFVNKILDKSLKDLRNQQFKYADIDLLVTYHPAALLRNPNYKKPAWEDFKFSRDKYLLQS